MADRLPSRRPDPVADAVGAVADAILASLTTDRTMGAEGVRTVSAVEAFAGIALALGRCADQLSALVEKLG
jgi:hypothetical protein